MHRLPRFLRAAFPRFWLLVLFAGLSFFFLYSSARQGRPAAGTVPPHPPAPPVRFLLGEETTRYTSTPAGRVHNLQLAAGRLNGLLLPPEAVFSFDAKIGPYTEGHGYHSAPTIDGNKFIPGVGGGVCQVAGTLYDAALVAGLKVLERHPHTLAVGYLPPGFDAMVAPGGLDLRLANDTGHPVVILAQGRDGTLTVSLWGTHPPSTPGRLETRILKVIPPTIRTIPDPSLPPGTRITENPGQPGYVVERWLLRAGHRLPLSTDHYLSRPALILEGPPAAVGEVPGSPLTQVYFADRPPFPMPLTFSWQRPHTP